MTASIPPISYDHYTVPTENGRVNDSRAYASPHRWLPLFRTLRQTTGLPDGDPESILSSHWLFPFYSVRTNTFFDNTEKTAEDDKAEEAVAADTTAEAGKENTEEDAAAQQEDDDEAEKHPKIKKFDRKTTVGAGLLYYNNLNDGLQKQFILSGIATTKKHDPLTFGTNSAFFGLFGKENRSWKTKKRFSPIYSKTVNQDNSSESSILFGMFGSKDTKSYHVSKIFFYPRVTPKMELDDVSAEEQLANEKKIRQQHLEFARQYAEMNYPEHAAVEFLLAEGEYENDLQLLRMAADQFALLDPDKLEKLLPVIGKIQVLELVDDQIDPLSPILGQTVREPQHGSNVIIIQVPVSGKDRVGSGIGCLVENEMSSREVSVYYPGILIRGGGHKTDDG